MKEAVMAGTQKLTSAQLLKLERSINDRLHHVPSDEQHFMLWAMFGFCGGEQHFLACLCNRLQEFERK